MASEIMAILATLILEYRMTVQSNIGNVTISALDIEYTVIPNIDIIHTPPKSRARPKVPTYGNIERINRKLTRTAW